jgi:hypothetical protein
MRAAITFSLNLQIREALSPKFGSLPANRFKISRLKANPEPAGEPPRK